MPQKLLKIDISYRTFLKAAFIFALIVFAYLVREVLLALAVGLIIAAAVDPLADWFEKRKIPRVLSILLVYVLIIMILASVVLLIVPPLASEMGQLADNMPGYLQETSDRFDQARNVVEENNLVNNFETAIDRIGEQLTTIAGNAIGSTIGFFGGLMSVILIVFLSFYLVVEERRIKNFFTLLIPAKNRKKVARLVNDSQKKIGAWMRGQIILSLVIFVVTWITLSLLGVKYALSLALIAGILEIIPIIGPIIAAIPAILVALSQSWWLGLAVLILYIIIQQLENHLLVPKIMQKAVGISPVLIILGILAGAKLGGILGMFVAVPIMAGLSVWVWEWIEIKNPKVKFNKLKSKKSKVKKPKSLSSRKRGKKK
ncbi:AI-2E family transporter [Patescibacteria group bacterium]